MDDIINYTMENPGNTNPNVLRSMLENYGGGNSSGYTITETVIHENENAVFTSNHYDFTPSFDKISGYVSINGVTTNMPVGVDGIVGVPCGNYGVTLAGLINNDVRLTATPLAETVPSLTNASVKLFTKTAEVTDDFVYAVAKAIEIIEIIDG